MCNFKSVLERLLPRQKLLVFLGEILVALFIITTAHAEPDDEVVFPRANQPAVEQPKDINAYVARPPRHHYHVLPNYNSFGIQLGSISVDFKYSDFLFGIPIITDKTVKSSSISGGLFYGFGSSYRSFYYGLELQGLINGAKANVVDQISIVTLKRQFKLPGTLALDFIPGILFTDKVLGFLRLGLAGSYLKVDLNLLNPIVAEKSFNKTVLGSHLGLGIDYFFTDSISLRGDYVFTSYGKASKHLTGLQGLLNYETDTTVRSSQFNIGIAYHF